MREARDNDRSNPLAQRAEDAAGAAVHHGNPSAADQIL
jgi:hypothetical protein